MISSVKTASKFLEPTDAATRLQKASCAKETAVGSLKQCPKPADFHHTKIAIQ